MVRRIHVWAFFCIVFAALEAMPMVASAQVQDTLANGPLDSLAGGIVRPRRETFIIQPFPSPAQAGQEVMIQYYNHNPQETRLRIVNILDRTVTDPPDLQPRQMMQNGLHKFSLSTSGLATGMYFIRLSTYTSTGALDQVSNERFVIVH